MKAASKDLRVPTGTVAGCTCLLVRKMARRVTQIYDRFLEPSGLTVTQFGMMAHLNAREDVSVGELAERLVSDPTTLTRNLRPLERQGYIKIVPARDDRRRRAIALTARGRAVFRDAAPLWRQAQAEIAATLGKDGIDALTASLSRSLDRLATRGKDAR